MYWIRSTGGVFQPLVGGALVAWGYRRSLADRKAYAESSPDPRRLEGRPQVDRVQGNGADPGRDEARPRRDRKELDGVPGRGARARAV